MARLKRELAEIDYMAGMKYKDIAEKYGVSLNTVKSWKKRYGWHREKGCTQIKRVHKNCISQIGNRNATGPPGNRNAEKYGFYSKFLPEETKEIVFHDEDPLDVLWVQIRFAHAALIRAQQIAYVESQKDKTVDVISTTTGDAIESTTLAIQQAWDKQENFMKAQSHAQATLAKLIRQYDEMLHERGDLASEEQRARIMKLTAEAEQIKAAKADESADSGDWKAAVIAAAERRQQNGQ
ncbi:MAG: phage terminase small subunit [Clostridiales bacterium]|nr:phage terminase small subunit [Clostridiales bacterium]